MRYYKVDNSLYTYDELHNTMGYSREPTDPVTYKSTGTENNSWGDIVGNGYLETIYRVFTNAQGFCQGISGWYNLNSLAINHHIYPSNATEIILTHSTLGQSHAAVIEFYTSYRPVTKSTRYLIEKDLSVGWITEQEYIERGWQPYENYYFLLYNKSSDEVHGVESDDNFYLIQQSQFPPIVNYIENYNPNINVSVDGSINTNLISYDSKLYIPIVITRTESWVVSAEYFGWNSNSLSDKVTIVNNTGIEKFVISVLLLYIDSNNAEIVVVKNAQEEKFNSFKYTLNNISYWYVNDGIQENWVDDLSSIGYSIVSSN